jgi:hypothetical protein
MAQKLQEKRQKPQPIKRAHMPKANGKMNPFWLFLPAKIG